MGQTRFNRGTRLLGPAHAHHRVIHQVVTMLTIKRAPAPFTISRGRPRAVAALSSHVGTTGAPPPLFLLSRPCLTPLWSALGHPHLLTIAVPLRHLPSRGSTLSSPPLRLAPASSPSRWLSPPPRALLHRRLFLDEFTIDRSRSCTSDPATTSRRTVRACSSSTSTPSPSATFRLHRHRSPSPTRVYRCRKLAPVSPRSIQCLPSVPRGPGVPHGSTLPAVSTPTGGISSVQHGRRKGIGGPLLRLTGRKVMWAGAFCAIWVVLHSGQA
jgi:hypothetical protein